MIHRPGRGATRAAVAAALLAAAACSAPTGCGAPAAQGCPTATATAMAVSPSAAADQTPTLAVDRPGAAAGTTVTITGGSFAPRETVQILLSAIAYKQVPADQNGAFTTTMVVSPQLPASFPIGISAIGETSGKSAMTTFERSG